MEQIHGHEVINLIAAANRPMSRDEIIGEANLQFGSGARYFTCSAEGMDAAGLVDFLVARGKIEESAAGWSLRAASVCNH